MNSVNSNPIEAIKTPRPRHLNFETPCVRFAYHSAPSHYFEISEVARKGERKIIHTFSSSGQRKLWDLAELIDKRDSGEIDFLTHENHLQSSAFVDGMAYALCLTPEQAFVFQVRVRLCQLADNRRAHAMGHGGRLSVRRACLDIIEELTLNNGRLGELDGQDSLVVSVDHIPSLPSFKRWYKACRDSKYTELIPYLQREQSVPCTSAFSNLRLTEVFGDIVEDAKRTESPIDYPHMKGILDELAEQRHDENRLLELRFVLAERSRPEGLRSRRQKLLVDWHRQRALCVAVGFGGEVFYRPCRTQAEYNEILERLLRPPAGDTLNHPRAANKPYYVQADLSEIAKRIQFWSNVYAEAIEAAIETGPMPELTLPSFYRHLDRLPDYERGQLHMSSREHQRAFGIQFGHNRSGAVDAEWQGDGTALNLICVDDQLGLPLGRLYAYKVVESVSGYRLGAALGFGGESVSILGAALRMALASGNAKLGLARLLDLEHEVLGGRKPGVFCHDHGAAFLSSHIGIALTNLGVVSRPAPKGDPTFRSEVEGAMKDSGIVHQRLEGTTSWSPEWLKDFNYDPVKDAFVRLSDLKLHFYRNMFDVFNHKPVKSLQQRTRHQYYSVRRDSLGDEYDIAPPNELLKVFLSHYYTGLTFTRGGTWIEGIPYQFESENEDYRRLLGARDLVFTRNANELEVAYLVDGLNLEYQPLRVRPDYYEAVAGLDLWQLRAIQKADKVSPASTAEAQLEALLTQRQIRRDTLQSSLIAEEQRMALDLGQFPAGEQGYVGGAIIVSGPDAGGPTLVLPQGVYRGTPRNAAALPAIDAAFESGADSGTGAWSGAWSDAGAGAEADEPRDEPSTEDTNVRPEAAAPSWSLGKQVRQRGAR